MSRIITTTAQTLVVSRQTTEAIERVQNLRARLKEAEAAMTRALEEHPEYANAKAERSVTLTITNAAGSVAAVLTPRRVFDPELAEQLVTKEEAHRLRAKAPLVGSVFKAERSGDDYANAMSLGTPALIIK